MRRHLSDHFLWFIFLSALQILQITISCLSSVLVAIHVLLSRPFSSEILALPFLALRPSPIKGAITASGSLQCVYGFITKASWAQNVLYLQHSMFVDPLDLFWGSDIIMIRLLDLNEAHV